MTSKRLKIAGFIAAIVLAFGFGVYTGAGKTFASSAVAAASSTINTITLTFSNDKPANDADLKQFWTAWNLLQQNFVSTHASTSIPDTKAKLYGAIAGLVDSYGDPYTTFLPPTQAQIFTEDISGAFGGVGMELGIQENQIVVIAPLKDSPAQKAGVKAGDKVVEVDGVTTAGMSVDDAIGKIRGQKGTTVKLTLVRAGQEAPISVSIVRDTINIPVLTTEKRGDGIFVISLFSFSANSADLFKGALKEFTQSGSTKLLLDLRGNPGGYLEAAVNIASYFLPAGDVIVTEDYKGKQTNVAHRSLGYDMFKNQKLTMAILVDQSSASASEILAGALQQHNVAKLIGTRTFGKGSVQQLMDLGGGAELKVTVARWLTPNGSSISDGGLTPDIKAERTETDVKAQKDPQKDAAVLWLTQN